MPPGPPGIDDDTIRARCATPEAAAYTLYVRHLVAGPGLAGGQAEVLRTAAARRILPVGYTRQTLSEHLSGRYRHGPPWSTTEMIIDCLPEHASRDGVRAEAAALHRAAARRAVHRARSARTVPDRLRPDNLGSDRLRPDNLGSDNLGSDNVAEPVGIAGPGSNVRSGRLAERWPGRTAAGPAPIGTVRRTNGPAPGRHGTPRRGRTPNSAPLGDARPEANQPSGQYRRGSGTGGPGRDIAIDIADLRADCARLTVQVLLLGEPGTGSAHRAAELSAALERRRRGSLGQLSQHIEPAAPLLHRALAQYLCAYAELGRTTVTELAVRTGMPATAVAQILAARRMPTEVELRDLGAVLGVDGGVLWQLATPALGVRLGMPEDHR
ncbi:helix-turn-helix transcriptional regulator [Plantactinospora sp. B6F1]|uniref:helix-turn-helix domain-containing protein n=1 Tax=Plantactinospora sp. B6F1 TaxID=3158971 RepID=UPI0032D92A9A